MMERNAYWQKLNNRFGKAERRTTMKNYRVTIKVRTSPQRPVEMQLKGSEGSRVVMSAAKRVIATHEKVIKALANR
jgi:hypothetical protein